MRWGQFGTVVDDEPCLYGNGLELLVVVKEVIDGDDDDSYGGWVCVLE